MPSTPTEICHLTIHLLAGATGQPEEHWREVVGEVETTAASIQCHEQLARRSAWLEGDVVAVQAAIALVRADHPYVVG